MYCFKCGKLTPDGAKVCPYCGVALSERSESGRLRNSKQRKAPAIILISILTLLIIASIGVLLLTIRGHNTKEYNGNAANDSLLCKIDDQFFFSDWQKEREASSLCKMTESNGAFTFEVIRSGWFKDLTEFQGKLYYVQVGEEYFPEEEQDKVFGLHCYDPLKGEDSVVVPSTFYGAELSIIGTDGQALYFQNASNYGSLLQLYHVNEHGFAVQDNVYAPLLLLEEGILKGSIDSSNYQDNDSPRGSYVDSSMVQVVNSDGVEIISYPALGSMDIDRALFVIDKYLFLVRSGNGGLKSNLVRYNLEGNTYIDFDELLSKNSGLEGYSFEGITFWGNKLYYGFVDQGSVINSVCHIFTSDLNGEKLKEVCSFSSSGCDKLNFIDERHILVSNTDQGKWVIVDSKNGDIVSSGVH